MSIRSIAVATGLFLSAASAPSWAEGTSAARQTENKVIKLAGQDVPVVAGGLYDRYRSNPPLEVIKAEAPNVDLTWFTELKKSRVDVGFETYSPNFYYKISRATAIFTADLDRLRELMPAKVLEQVQPLQVWPGRGLVALTGYAYHYCDNDSYNEIGLSIITNKPGNANFGPVSLVGQALSKDFWGYVLKLPVNTKLAMVRGVVGYNLPKWLTEIDYKVNEKSVVFEIADAQTGKTDVIFETEKLNNLSNKVEMVTNSFTNVDQEGRLTYGYAVSRQLSHASSSSAESVNLQLSDGSFSTYIKSLKLGKMLRYEYVPDFQSALYTPKPLDSLSEDH
ncbi:MAG TPA: acetoacetate decarboxylase (ADC) [Noviherbaspirillum sp.]|nr:acetoacetate decarboxylase (ADC) [Noviherbaspirillum sp.]